MKTCTNCGEDLADSETTCWACEAECDSTKVPQTRRATSKSKDPLRSRAAPSEAVINQLVTEQKITNVKLEHIRVTLNELGGGFTAFLVFNLWIPLAIGIILVLIRLVIWVFGL